jgi:hypothetical protein
MEKRAKGSRNITGIDVQACILYMVVTDVRRSPERLRLSLGTLKMSSARRKDPTRLFLACPESGSE